jgi:hypothetical protein
MVGASAFGTGLSNTEPQERLRHSPSIPGRKRFGDEGSAREELVAELGSLMRQRRCN